jgi:hypothetical protein
MNAADVAVRNITVQGNLIPGISDLDFRTPVSLFWSHGTGLGKYPGNQAKGGESLVHSCCMSCCPMSWWGHPNLVQVSHTCLTYTPSLWEPTFHVCLLCLTHFLVDCPIYTYIFEWLHLPCTGTEVLCGYPDILTQISAFWLAIDILCHMYNYQYFYYKT